MQESLLAACEKVVGKQNPLTLAMMHALAQTYYSTNREKEAEQLECEVIKGRTNVLGVQHPDTELATESLASMRGNRAKRTNRNRQYPNAALIQPQCVQPMPKIVGPELQHAVDNMLALCEIQLGDCLLACIIGEIVVVIFLPGNSDWRRLSHMWSFPRVRHT